MKRAELYPLAGYRLFPDFEHGDDVVGEGELHRDAALEPLRPHGHFHRATFAALRRLGVQQGHQRSRRAQGSQCRQKVKYNRVLESAWELLHY